MASGFEQLLAEQEDREIPEPTPRSVALPSLPGKANALVGMRRVGKTWRLYQHMRERMAAGVAREQLLYVNLEDDRLEVDGARLGELLAAWEARYPDVIDRDRWLYLDEVQSVPGWERFVRRVLDERRVHVLVTGSSSKMLSAEIATSLRGRALSTEVLPFSFAEALVHAGERMPTRWPASSRDRARLRQAWQRYAASGGFPEVQGLEASLRRRILRDYVDVAVLRDIIERHDVGQVGALRWMVRRLLANPAGRFTANRLHRDLKSQGLAVGKDTVHELLGYVEDAHLVYTMPLWTASLARRNTNPRKAYPVDPALARTAAFAKPEDVGHHLECFVYLELRRRQVAELGYYETSEGYEVDFCGRGEDGKLQLVQVAADLSEPETRARELRALDAAMRERRVKTATLVTLNERGAESQGRRTVEIVPVWEWLLRPSE